jgi:hypothetical protein
LHTFLGVTPSMLLLRLARAPFASLPGVTTSSALLKAASAGLSGLTAPPTLQDAHAEARRWRPQGGRSSSPKSYVDRLFAKARSVALAAG